MPHGTESTLVIKPNASHLSDITIGLAGDEPYADTSDYICPLQTLDFNEEARRAIVYGSAPPGEGGRAVVEYGPLVPVTFGLVIKTDTVAERIDAFNALQAVLLDPEGGTIQYKPEDVGAGVEDTYYHYLQSPPPRLLDEAGNRWDSAPKSDEKYTLQVQVEFMTQPVATSDPDSPVTLTELAATVDNWIDDSPSQDNGVTISASNLKGTLPALLRIMARPGSDQYMARLLIFDRAGSSLSGNFVCILEAEDASQIYPSVAWSEQSDSDRGDGAYMECNPSEDANGEAQGLQFTISAPSYFHGRFAVLGIGKDESYTAQVWTHEVKLKVGNVLQSGESYHFAEYLDSWCVIYAGEFDFPPTDISAVETGFDEGPYLEWYSTRASGTSKFNLDAVFIFFVADKNLKPSGIDVVCLDEGGVTNSEKLLLENFPGKQGIISEIAHVVAQSDEDFKRVTSIAPRGDFLMLDPDQDHLLTFLQERYNGTILDDDFESYKGSRWLEISGMEESAGAWEGSYVSEDTTNQVEGNQCIELQHNSGADEETATLDETGRPDFFPADFDNDTRFGSGDFVVWYNKTPDASTTTSHRIYCLTGVDAYTAVITGIVNGDNFLYKKKGDFGVSGSPDWADIDGVRLIWHESVGNTGLYTYYDYLRIEKADPDDSSNPNATGSVWDFQPTGGRWTITEDISGAGATLACLDAESGVEKCAEIAATTSDDVRHRAKVYVHSGASSYVGIIWRSSDITEGSEDFYAAVFDIANDKVLVREYNAGAITQHANPSFTCAVETWYTIGVISKGSTHEVYATASSNLTDQGDVFDRSYLVATVSDATHTSGQAGVISISASSRFDEVKLENVQDRVVPADQITLEGKAIFRTLAPFSE